MEINFNEIQKILIIQYQPFGDVLLNTGYLPALRKKFPSAKIDYLVRKPYHVVLENNPYLDELVTFDSAKGIQYLFERIKLYFRIRQRRYDLVIDQIKGTGSAQMVLVSGAKYRLGYKDARWAFIYNVKANRGEKRYYSSLKFDLLQPLGIKEEPHQLYYYIKPESFQYIDNWLSEKALIDKKIICISPGSPVPKKKWKHNHYAQVADLILENTDREVVLLWGPREEDDVDAVVRSMKNKPIIALPTDFNQAGALLTRSELLICNDGGINHLAVAVKTPTIAIFGNTNPVKWVNMVSGINHYFYNENFNSKKDNSFGISPDIVFQKIKELIKT